MKKTFTLAIVCILSVILFSCNNADTSTADTIKTADTASTPTAAPATAFTPFDIMLIEHTVADYPKWRPGYDAHDSVRKAYGQTDGIVLRGKENPNKVVVIEKIADVQKANDFTVLPNLKEAMAKAGVTGKPAFSYYHIIRADDAVTHTKDRVFVTHKVKDFDTWIKAYDGEGIATRASEGMADQLLARGIDDPNMVYIVFAVTDMAKAKAAIFSEAKKKLMISAGVEGIPTIEFYTTAD